MAKLTKNLIEHVPAVQVGKQKIYWDHQQRGLGLRCTSGAKSFVFQGRVSGRSVRTTIGAWPDWSVDMARERARELAVMVDRSIDPRQVKKQGARVTLQRAYDEFAGERQLKDRTRKDYARYLKHYLSPWREKGLEDIDSGMVLKRYRAIAASSSGGAQASSAMRFLRSVFNFAQATYGKKVVPDNPVLSLTAKRAWLRNNARTDHLRPHEIKPFIRAVRALTNAVMAAYIELVLLSGARRSEAAKLKWKDIDAKAGVLTFRDTKNHTDRSIPITPRMGEILDGMRRLKMGEYVFAVMGKNGKPTHITEPRKAIAAANKAAESAVTIHGLRRTYATVLESLDCPAYPLKALLGHSMKSDVTTTHYAQLSVERLRPWALRYEDHLLKLIGDKTGGKVIELESRATAEAV